MHLLTNILLTREESRVIADVVSISGIGLEADERADARRTVNGVSQVRDILSHERLGKAYCVLKDSVEVCERESDISFWRAQSDKPLTDQEEAMAKVLVEARTEQVARLNAAIDIVAEALVHASMLPPDEKYEGV